MYIPQFIFKKRPYTHFEGRCSPHWPWPSSLTAPAPPNTLYWMKASNRDRHDETDYHHHYHKLLYYLVLLLLLLFLLG